MNEDIKTKYFPVIYLGGGKVAQRVGCQTCDSYTWIPIGHCCAANLRKLLHPCASVTKQYNLAQAMGKGQWCPAAGKVTGRE